MFLLRTVKTWMNKSYLAFLLFVVSIAGNAQNYCPSTAFFCDEFYSRDFSAWLASGTTPAAPAPGVTISTSIYHSGAGASFQASLPVDGGQAMLISPSFRTKEAWGQFWIYIPSSFSMVNAFNIATLGSAFRLRYSDGFYLEDNDWNLGTHALSTNAWHSIQIHTRAGSGNGIEQVYVDGILDINTNHQTISAPIDVFYIGPNNSDSTASGSLYFADVVVQGGSAQPVIGSSGFNVRYPNTAARSAFPVNVIMWGENPTDVLSATVDGTAVFTSSDSLAGNITFPVDLTALAAGSHALTVTLKTEGGTTRNIFSGTFQKYMNGTPLVYLDANNSLHYHGSLFFQVSAFLDNTSGDTFANWGSSAGAINTQGWQGCFQNNFAYSPAQFQNCVDVLTAAPYTGPGGNWQGGVDQPAATSVIANYAALMANDPYLVMWTWADEPSGKVTLAQMQAATDATHTNDPNHPVAVNNGGYTYDVVQDRGKNYYYPLVPFSTGLVGDVNSIDFYPFIYSPNPTPPPANWYVYQMVDSFDACANRYVYGLIPCMAFIEGGTCATGGCTGQGPTPTQTTMEAWLAVIHGLKGIQWWGPAGWTSESTEQWAAMAQFRTLVTAFQNVILSPTTLIVNSNQTVPHSRVDATVRDDADNVYVFAARLSDIGESSDPTIRATLTVTGANYSGPALVAIENRAADVSSGAITDTFTPSAVHIYCFPKKPSSPLPPCPTVGEAKEGEANKSGASLPPHTTKISAFENVRRGKHR